MRSSLAGSTLRYLALRENQIFLALTIVIAVIAGLSAVLFTLTIQGVQHGLFGMEPAPIRLLLIPPIVSLLAGFLLVKFFPEARGNGVSQTKAAYHLNRGRIPFKIGLGKFITGAMCIGAGHSMGNEGPSVQIGASVAAALGKRFYLSPDRARNLVPVGAAAALAAAFNTPVAAVLFALEEIIGDMNAPMIGSTVLASVTAVIVERSLLGDQPLFRVPAYHLAHPAELGCYAVLGVVGGVISLLFSKGLLGLRDWFARLPKRSIVVQPAMGGVVLGATLIFVPQVMGVGYEYVDQALNGGLVFRTMVLLTFVKLFATVVSSASGNTGGIFAPSLYLGAMAGGSVGWLVQHFAPFPTGDVGAYALVGMGTLFAGIIRAPMTSVFMIFELTQDYQILVPLMIANMLAFSVSKRYQSVPLYHALLEQSGIHLPTHDAASSRALRRVRDVMASDVTIVPETTPLQKAYEIVRRNKVVLVGTLEHIAGVVDRKKIEEGLRADGNQSLGAVTSPDFPFLYPDDLLDTALEKLAASAGVVPVLSRSGMKFEGAVTIESIMQLTQSEPNPAMLESESVG